MTKFKKSNLEEIVSGEWVSYFTTVEIAQRLIIQDDKVHQLTLSVSIMHGLAHKETLKDGPIVSYILHLDQAHKGEPQGFSAAMKAFTDFKISG